MHPLPADKPVDLTPKTLAPLFEVKSPRPDLLHTADGEVVILPSLSERVTMRTPTIHYYTPEQAEALVMQADEISFDITHLNIGRPTVEQYGHVGAVLKRNGEIIGHLDGLPAEKARQPDGTDKWVPVGMGMHNHQIKLFCLTPETMRNRASVNNDNDMHKDIGSINLAELSLERRQTVASRVRWAMEEIDSAQIPYIVPGITVSREIAHILVAHSNTPFIGGAVRAVLKTAAGVKVIEDIDGVIDLAGHRLQKLVALPASMQSGHRIVPDEQAQVLGANSKDILLALTDILERREDVDQMLTSFLARPGMENFRLPGGNSDVLRATLWRFAPKVWKDIEAEAKAERIARHKEAVGNMGRLAAAGAAIVFIMQSGGTATAMEGVRLVQNKIGSGGDPLLMFKQTSAAAGAAVGVAVDVLKDPGTAVETASQIARNPWQALSDIVIPGGATVGLLIAYYTARPDTQPKAALAQPAPRGVA